MNYRITPTRPVVDLRDMRPPADQADLLNLLAQAQETDRWDEHDYRHLTAPELFEAHHERYPLLYDVLRNVATYRIRRARRRGAKRIGFPNVWEHVRWEVEDRFQGDGSASMNNNLRSYYSRLLLAQEQELADAWEIRASAEADGWIAARLAKQIGQAA